MLAKFLELFWGKFISLSFVLLFLIGFVYQFKPDDGESNLTLIITIIVASIVFILYLIWLIRRNLLPRCKKDEIGVLFIFKVASEQQYKDFKFSVENNFKFNLENMSIKIRPLCINSSALKEYDITNIPYMENLLVKTNCYFCVDFFVETDSPDSPSIYNTTIRTGFLHPKAPKSQIDHLMNNLVLGSKRIRKLKFETKDKIENLKIISEYLAILSKYAIGVTLILGKNPTEALLLLENLYHTIDNNHVLYADVCSAVYEAYARKIDILFNEYYNSYDISILNEIELYVLSANKVIPDQYSFYLTMAYIAFLKYRNVNLAKECIKKCKAINENDFWQYSEAFLIAYESNDPNIVYSKYKKLKNNSYNIVKIIEFIEYVLETQPQKIILHLVLGMLYDNKGDPILANCHFKQFLNNYNGKIKLRKNSIDVIKEKIDTTLCAVKCELDDSSCIKCTKSTTTST